MENRTDYLYRNRMMEKGKESYCKLVKKQFKNILKINLIIGKKIEFGNEEKKAVRGRNIIIANGEKKDELK